MQAIIQAWLDGQCGQIDGATGAVVLLLPRNSDSLVPAAYWPRDRRVGKALQAIATAAYQRKEQISLPRLNGAERPLPQGPTVSCPIQVKGRTVGAVAVSFATDIASLPPSAVAGISRSAEGFENFLRQNSPGARRVVSRTPIAPAKFAPDEPTRKLVRTAPLVDAHPTQTGSIAVAPPPPAIPAMAIATRPIPTLRESIDRTVELHTPNAARILQLLATIEAHKHFEEAATAFVTDLATLFRCDRVSLGLLGRRRVEVEGLSHSTDFRASQSLLRDIGAAMEEAVWQGVMLISPLPEGAQPRVDRAHADLSQRHGSGWIATVPLVKTGKAFGAIMLERNGSESLSRAELTLCENIGALLGPLLDLKREVDRPWPAKMRAALAQATAPLFGSGHVALKGIVAAILAIIVGGAFIQGDYRVASPARLEGAVQRVMVAPADGYLKVAHVRPGDRVKKDQLLAELADEDLQLEERKAQSEVSQLENSYSTALVKQDRAEVAIIFSKLDEARAELGLIQSRLSRTQIVAPFDGLVITGDLTQALGAPVKKGEALMTLAPEHDFRVIVEVDE
ncbi:MAG: GAF domain-containing protein, partial [Betaproteobacteria bacterium]